ERLHLLAEDVGAGGEDLVDRGFDFIRHLPVLRREIDQRDHRLTASSRPPFFIDLEATSSARTTTTAARPPPMGGVPLMMQSRKCSHSARSGSPTGTLGIRISPSRTWLRKAA